MMMLTEGAPSRVVVKFIVRTAMDRGMAVQRRIHALGLPTGIAFMRTFMEGNSLKGWMASGTGTVVQILKLNEHLSQFNEVELELTTGREKGGTASFLSFQKAGNCLTWSIKWSTVPDQ